MNESMWNQLEDTKMEEQVQTPGPVAERAAKEFVIRLGLFSNSTSREVIVRELALEFEKFPNKVAVDEASKAGFRGT